MQIALWIVQSKK